MFMYATLYHRVSRIGNEAKICERYKYLKVSVEGVDGVGGV